MTVENTPAAWTERAEIEDPHEAVGWSEAGQRERFASVLEHVNPRVGETLVDFGCGTGALCELLPAEVSYIGYDSSPGMVARARRDHPGRQFTTLEPGFASAMVCVGALNLPGSKLETWATLRRLWDKTSRVLAVSLYAGLDDRCLIYTDDEVEAFARSESYYSFVDRHRYNDLLMVLRK
jgi:SAM-dependent methyltransferase